MHELVVVAVVVVGALILFWLGDLGAEVIKRWWFRGRKIPAERGKPSTVWPGRKDP
jgi:membrane protein DedA with SNARE-associated domain